MDEQMEIDLANLLNDPAFEELKLRLERPNVFEVLGIARREVRHSNFLGWLLDPAGSHGLRAIFLERFMRDVIGQWDGLRVLEVERMDLNAVDVRREWRHIDILVKCDRFVVVIENKIDSQDHSDQLSRYRTIATDEFGELPVVCVYLTPDGDEPREDAGYLTYSYADIQQHLQSILSLYASSLTDRQAVYLEDYLTVLSRHIMKNDPLNDLVETLYKKHQTALDFIIDNLPDMRKEVMKTIEELIMESGWIQGSTNNKFVRFLTPELDEHVRRYSHKNGWKNGESMLLEFVINIGKADKLNLVFKPVISPGGAEDEPYRNGLIEAMSNIEGASAPKGAHWVVHFTIKHGVAKISEHSAEERKRKLREFWPEVEKLTKKVEAGLLPYLSGQG